MTTSIKPFDRVRTLVAVGPKLPAGSVGVVSRVDTSLYPHDQAGLTYPITVVFPTLGNATTVYRDIDGLTPASVPHMNAIPFRLSEVEYVDSLGSNTPRKDRI